MADSNMNDGTSFQQTDLPILCASGCGFFGTAATMNMCSKCYRDHRMKEEQAASAKAAVEKSLAPPPSPVTLVVSPKGKDVAQSSSEPMVEEAVAMEAAASTATEKAKNRCGCCNKKVGVVGFTCRCGSTFCGSHRYPEEHKCTFDYKEAGKEALTKANPVIKADKLDYRF